MDIQKLKKETEEKYLRIDNQMKAIQQALNESAIEKTRLEGEIRLLEQLEKENNETKEEK